MNILQNPKMSQVNFRHHCCHQEVISETSIVLPPALSAMEYVSARPLFQAFLSRLACLLAAFSSGVSISLHQSIRIRTPYTRLQVCPLKYSPHCTAVLTCTHRTRDRLQPFCLAGITLQRLSDVLGVMQLLRTIRQWCPRWGFVPDPETHPQPGAAAVTSNLHKLMHCH